MLFNWLYARHTGGRVVLRFEDTDRARSTEEAIAQAEDVLRWLGIDWDEGPYRQTQRLDLYARRGRRAGRERRRLPVLLHRRGARTPSGSGARRPGCRSSTRAAAAA